MKILRVALVATTLLASACGSDDGSRTTGSTNGGVEARLSAALATPTVQISNPNVTMSINVTSALQESVQGGICASVVQARAMNGTSWVDVLSDGAACSTIAILLRPSETVTLTATADQAKLRAVAGATSRSVVVRVRHTLNGASANYTLQSNEVTVALP